MKIFPHRTEVMHPIEDFNINGRTLSLYTVDGRVPGFSYTLYWNDEENPIQHAMSPREIFAVLHQLLGGE